MSSIFDLEQAVALISSATDNDDDDDDDERKETFEVEPVVVLDLPIESTATVTTDIDVPISNTVELVTTLSDEEHSDIDDDVPASDCDYIPESEDSEASETADYKLTDTVTRPESISMDEEAFRSKIATTENAKNEIDEVEVEPSGSVEENDKTKRQSRKRKRDPEKWKQKIRKRNRQAGRMYVNSKGRQTEGKAIRTTKDCHGKCKFKCSHKVNMTQRESTFKSFWAMNDNEKFLFYSKTVDRSQKKRCRTEAEKRNIRTFSYAYYLFHGSERIRVCKEFYLTTLSISQRRISYFFEKKYNDATDVPLEGDMRGKHTSDRISSQRKEYVRNRINSFPRIQSHYCRARTQKEYLDQNLTLATMHRLYTENCTDEGQEPVKYHIYRNIFNTDFNIDFHKPKSDRCDKCEEYRVQEKYDSVDEELREEFLSHFRSKVSTKEERDSDRQDKTKAVICFDLENVLSCPQANISSFFYRRKLSVYNLTAHCSLDGQGYSALWNEVQAGRGANEIASALIAILKQVVQKHKPQHLTLWSDSCVAQNRNSGMSFALKDFMKKENTTSITQKFCEPGHSVIQECDNIHSQIERELRKSEVYSPLGLMRCIKAAMKTRPLVIIQMRNDQFFKYIEASRKLNFVTVPFTQVKSLDYAKNDPYSVVFKTTFDQSAEQTKVSIRQRENRRRMSSPSRSPTVLEWPKVLVTSSKPVLSKDKAKDIKAMVKFMPPNDQKFMSGLVKHVTS